jgi:hypothetical protein
MTLHDLEKTLPSGFHDSKLHGISIDYGEGVAQLAMSIDSGAVDEDEEPIYRPVRILIRGLASMAPDPPEKSLLLKWKGDIWMLEMDLLR